MQSGIKASQELFDAFEGLTRDSSQRGLLVGIESEKLVPREKLASASSDFMQDVGQLSSVLKDDEAAYIILRRYAGVQDGFVVVTYVPDTANVRQKMLFASTQMTLTRELGTEKFRESIFANTKAELTTEGWKKHDQHGKLDAPLTEEERTLQAVKEAEAETSRSTGDRKAHFTQGLSSPISDEAMKALKDLPEGNDNLVQLKLDIATETVQLASTSQVELENLSSSISNSEPRYSFYRYHFDAGSGPQSSIVFISSCPSNLPVKDRMIYAASRAMFLKSTSQEAGIEASKRFEVSDPSELTAATIADEFKPQEEKPKGFARPRRPGRR